MMRRLLLLTLDVCTGSALSAQPTDALVGLWSTESILGSPLRGELRVVRKGTNWTATLGDVGQK
jgi:hypothetical protein